MPFSLDPDKRREAARIEELRESLKRVERADFWQRLMKTQPPSGETDSFQDAVARRAEERQLTPDQLLTSYVEAIRNSTYPTPECLQPEEVQAVAASHAPTAEQGRHLETCDGCRQLVAAAEPSAAEMNRLMKVVRESAGEAKRAHDRILVIQHGAERRAIVKNMLSSKGYEIIEAESGEEGVRLAQETHPSVVVLNVRLPGMDGIQTLGLLRSTPVTRAIPVMAMTPHVGVDVDRERVAEAGFDACEAEPIDAKKFVATVERLLERG
jgi:two-component system cell cycle response regulator DivK